MTMTAPLALLPCLLLLVLLCFHSAGAGHVWTVDCIILTTQRMDPIVLPGESPGGHVHAIVGGSNFNVDLTYDDTQQSQCNSCNAGDDLSNYWVPQLYVYKQADHKYHYIPMEFHIYYKLINDKGQTDSKYNPITPGDKFVAFPENFRMLVGNPFATEGTYQLHGLGHQCLGPNTLTKAFPPRPEECRYGVRGEATFPSCWDGENLYSKDNSHVSYPVGGNWAAGACPTTHPYRLPTVFYEAIYKTYEVPFEAGDELVYSFNDWDGYGFHGDFFNGWKEGVVDTLIAQCAAGTSKSNCGLDKSSSYSCDWEGTEDDSVFTGVTDDLPPCSDSCLYDYLDESSSSILSDYLSGDSDSVVFEFVMTGEAARMLFFFSASAVLICSASVICYKAYLGRQLQEKVQIYGGSVSETEKL